MVVHCILKMVPMKLIIITNEKQLTLIDNAAETEGGAIYVGYCDATLSGNVKIANNTANEGGGIRADKLNHIFISEVIVF